VTRLVDEVLALARSRPPTLGAGRLVAIDGPAGSGKSTLATAISAQSGAPVIHLDDLYDGWTGLPLLDDQLTTLFRPLAHAEPGVYRRYDWHAGDYAETVAVEPTGLLVVEGVGAGSRSIADLVTVLVWLDAPVAVRRERALARDGETFAPHWDAWAATEAEHYAVEGTASRADVTDWASTGPRLGSTSRSDQRMPRAMKAARTASAADEP